MECMPNKIAENQFFHIAEREGLLSLTLSLNGDAIPNEPLDNFAFEVHSRFRKRMEDRANAPKPEARPPAQPLAMLGDVGMIGARRAMRLAAWAFPGAVEPFRIMRDMVRGPERKPAGDDAVGLEVPVCGVKVRPRDEA